MRAHPWFAISWWSFRNRFRRLRFEQNYNQYFVNAFIINLNKYLHFRRERGPIKTLLMFHRKCWIIIHIRFFQRIWLILYESYNMSHIWWVIPYHSYVFSTRLLFYLLIFWISFGPALKCMMNPSFPAHHPSSYMKLVYIFVYLFDTLHWQNSIKSQKGWTSLAREIL